MHRLLAALDRRLEALVTLVYGPLPMDEYRVGLGAKVGVLLLFAALVALGLLLTPGCSRPPAPDSMASYSYEIRSNAGGGGGKVTGGVVDATVGGNRLAIRDGRLTANGKPYGTVKDGDRVLLDKDGAVYVNGEMREPE